MFNLTSRVAKTVNRRCFSVLERTTLGKTKSSWFKAAGLLSLVGISSFGAYTALSAQEVSEEEQNVLFH